MKQLTNFLFICLLAYVSSLSLKHKTALNSKSFLQTKIIMAVYKTGQQISECMVSFWKQIVKYQMERTRYVDLI